MSEATGGASYSKARKRALPDRLQMDEIVEIARRIPRVWTQVALLTNLFETYETEEIDFSRDKALTMLTRYMDRGGTRQRLAGALEKLRLTSLSENVRSGYFIDTDQTDGLDLPPHNIIPDEEKLQEYSPRNSLQSVPQAGENSFPSPPHIDVIELEDMNPVKTEWSEATKTPIDVVLLVVNDNEFRAAYAILPEPVLQSDSKTSLGMVYFGQIEENKVALVRSGQGASGLLGIQAASLDIIEKLHPETFICLGVCFGMDKNKQKLGDVLISTKLGTYAPRRTNDDGSRIPRGVISECQPRLSKLFVDGKVGWRSPRGEECKPEVKDGLIISGPELVDCKDRKEELRRLYPDAIGGEMEGEGLYNICERFKIPWIVCKAISDWADGTKNKEWQLFAAAVSASLVRHVLTRCYIPEIQNGQS